MERWSLNTSEILGVLSPIAFWSVLNFTISMVEVEEMQKLNKEEREKIEIKARFIELRRKRLQQAIYSCLRS